MKLITDDGYPVVNMQALADQQFKVAGELIATSLVQEGPAAYLLSSNVYDYIVRGIGSVQADNWILQVEDDVLKTTIEKVTEVVVNEILSIDISLYLPSLQIINFLPILYCRIYPYFVL